MKLSTWTTPSTLLTASSGSPNYILKRTNYRTFSKIQTYIRHAWQTVLKDCIILLNINIMFGIIINCIEYKIMQIVNQFNMSYYLYDFQCIALFCFILVSIYVHHFFLYFYISLGWGWGQGQAGDENEYEQGQCRCRVESKLRSL